MRLEHSAGMVVFRDDPEVSAGRLYLLLDYGRHWDYPKGHLEDDEDAMAAALRELAEETGITDAQVIPGFAREIIYFFRAKRSDPSIAGSVPRGTLIKKQVTFYLARVEHGKVHLSDEHCGFEYLPFDRAVEKLTFATARQVLRAAEEFLRSRP